jgi:glycosyltransferase involved in cell wall biosynthesis
MPRRRYGKKQKLSLVQTMSPLREARPEAKLLIVGEGEEREPLQQEIHERGLEQTVLLIGERHDIPNLLAISECSSSLRALKDYPGWHCGRLTASGERAREPR